MKNGAKLCAIERFRVKGKVPLTMYECMYIWNFPDKVCFAVSSCTERTQNRSADPKL